MFNDEIGITGLVLTKLDGTAKGGIVIRIAKELNIPIRYIGIGEGVEDLRVFKSEEFVNALFD
jgi:fused signal recognition particle receptor